MHSTSITTMAALLLGASAHMVMKTPVPFGLDANGAKLSTAPYGTVSLENIPLGSVQLFPCQFGPNFEYPTSNPTRVAAGSSTLLTFQGSVVHGGGSCQVSLAKTASKDPKDWHVIHSIIGGCPGTNAPGAGANGKPGGRDNLKLDPQTCTGIDTDELTCLKKFNIPIPKDVASGKYFLAWTWFNKTGGREMYMNCAPLEVTDGGSSDAWLNKQPGIFYANIGQQPCETLEGSSLNFTQPGDSVLYSQNPFDDVDVKGLAFAPCAALYPPQSSQPAHVAYFKSAAGGGGTAPTASTGSGTASSASTGSPPTATSIVGTTTVTASAAQTNAPVSALPTSAASSPGVFAPGASSAPAAPATSSAPAAPVASSNPSTPVASCAHPCPEDGKIICFSTVSFGLCNHGCAVPQDVAAGTTCQNGGIGAAGRSGKRALKEKSRVTRSRRAPLRKSEWID
ncbi:hypothetical protein Vi05172_g5408 [Venturia inaequalis]|nr:hypothetical protein Vi05172_g5408 [Venturia inaequalis]